MVWARSILSGYEGTRFVSFSGYEEKVVGLGLVYKQSAHTRI